MLGPVSDTGRAMMASLQQAIQKGMPIEQAITYVKGMATQGVAPMVDLYAMLNQFERLKQPMAQPPQGGTVRDQIAAAAAQRDQQEAMQRGLASMPMQRAPQNPMEQGLGGVPAPAMESAQFAGGGIVAFDRGGFITNDPAKSNPSNDPLYPEQTLRKLREQAGIVDPYELSEADKFLFYGMPPDDDVTPLSDRELLNEYLGRVAKDPAAIGAGLGGILGGPIGIPVGGYIGRTIGQVVGKAHGGIIGFDKGGTTPKPTNYADPRSVLKGLTEELNIDPTEYLLREARSQEEAYKAMGLGAAAKSREEEIARQQAEAQRYSDTAAQSNLVQYFFDLAANAAKPGAKFLSAAALAAPAYGQRRNEIEEKARNLKNMARESQLKLQEAEELRKAGYLKDAAEKRKEARKQAFDVGKEIFSAQTQRDVANIYKADPVRDEIARLTKIVATAPRYSAEYREALERLRIIDPKQAAVQARLTTAQRNNIAAMHRKEMDVMKGIITTSLNDAEKAKAQARIDEIIKEAAEVGISEEELAGNQPRNTLSLQDTFSTDRNVLMPQRGPVIQPMNTAGGNMPNPQDPFGLRTSR